MLVKPLEVRWHGRGGQGAKTASYLLAEAAMRAGKYIQAFPEFGPERRGAPVKAFTRISDRYIRVRSQIYTPDAIIVLDPSLFAAENVLEGVPEGGEVIINTPLSPQDARRKFKIEGRKVFTLDATTIALEEIKRPIPNVPMIGAFIRATGTAPLKAAEEGVREHFKERYGEEMAEANVRAMRRGYEEVRRG